MGRGSLDVDAVVGVLAVDDVEQRNGQDVRVRTAEVAEQGQVGRIGRLRDRGLAEDRVRAVRDLFSVPSVAMRISSMTRCSLASTPRSPDRARR
jgi:hypothetical protein